LTTGLIDASANKDTFVTPLMNGPKNSIAETYGDGYNLCGALSYSILGAESTKLDPTGIVKVNAF